MEIMIDLKEAKTEGEVLNLFGKALGYTREKSWGKNWDAFKDILGYLDTGGICGANNILQKPLLLIKNSAFFKHESPEEFEILFDILNNESKRSGFEFIFIE